MNLPDSVLFEMFHKLLQNEELARFDISLCNNIDRKMLERIFALPAFFLTTHHPTDACLDWIARRNLKIRNICICWNSNFDFSRLNITYTTTIMHLGFAHITKSNTSAYSRFITRCKVEKTTERMKHIMLDLYVPKCCGKKHRSSDIAKSPEIYNDFMMYLFNNDSQLEREIESERGKNRADFKICSHCYFSKRHVEGENLTLPLREICKYETEHPDEYDCAYCYFDHITCVRAVTYI